jgi:hypothetical protein
MRRIGDGNRFISSIAHRQIVSSSLLLLWSQVGDPLCDPLVEIKLGLGEKADGRCLAHEHRINAMRVVCRETVEIVAVTRKP